MNILSIVRDLVCKLLGTKKDELDDTVTLDDLGLDSFEIAELGFDLEDKFGILIKNMDENWTIPDLARECENLVKEKQNA